MIYIRREAELVRKYQLGIQWWRGLNLFWATQKRIYIFRWAKVRRWLTNKLGT